VNEFPEPKSVPTWRIVFYGLLAAAGVAAVGYWQHEPSLYVFAIFAGVVIGGFGFVLKSAQTLKSNQSLSQIRGELERKRSTDKHKSTALFIFQILAIPTAIVGCVLIYDLFIATPEHDTATVVGKYVGSSGKAGHSYNLQVKGLRVYQKAVPFWFYNDCSLNDTVELSLTPIFKDWHQVSLIRNGMVKAKTIPSDTYWMTFFAFGSLLPILLLVRPIRDYFGENSLVPYKDKIIGVYFVIVFMCEIMAVGVGLKFLCVLLGFSATM
jgi:hypothetical protein